MQDALRRAVKIIAPCGLLPAEFRSRKGRHKIAPRRGSMISAAIRPQGILYKLPFF